VLGAFGIDTLFHLIFCVLFATEAFLLLVGIYADTPHESLMLGGGGKYFAAEEYIVYNEVVVPTTRNLFLLCSYMTRCQIWTTTGRRPGVYRRQKLSDAACLPFLHALTTPRSNSWSRKLLRPKLEVLADRHHHQRPAPFPPDFHGQIVLAETLGMRSTLARTRTRVVLLLCSHDAPQHAVSYSRASV
jgi:hypothetical protein